jgi:CRISPR-associated endonuclease/helicase Cas3
MGGDGIPLSDDFLRLWAKGGPTRPDDPYHPLICHLVDVARVAERLWDECIPTSAQEWFAEQLGLDRASTAPWAAFFAASHDVGKASPAFLERHRFLRPVPHGTVSTVILRERLAAEPFVIGSEVAERLATVIGGHHGMFPSPAEIGRAGDERQQVGRGDWKSRQAWLLAEIRRLTGVEQAPPPSRLTNAGALWLAGFISVADWIGSNSEFFPYAAPDGRVPPEFSVDGYAETARGFAERSLVALGWNAWPRETESRPFGALFPLAPNDLQEKSITMADGLERPALVIVEAPMGEGKTEAALYVADRGNAALGMRGHYVALPTQATSNQMFSRVCGFLQNRYPDEVVNAQLLHGRASLLSDFAALTTTEASFLGALDIPEDQNRGFDGAQPGVVAASWFTARKRGLLAPFGVGTVDQALLAVLQTRHFFVRLLGLAGKTVVFDEVHAYDTYMSVLLERLLGWLAALGCSVVLLSATLPKARRDSLLRAYSEVTAGDPYGGSESAAAYPTLTWRSGGAGGALELAVSPRSRKQVALRWMTPSGEPPSGELGARLTTALRDGGCAAVICNTVRGAQQTYQTLKAHFLPEELSLFHARFLFEDRAERERDTLRRFGKPGEGVDRPHRAVLVATQVIEQSLDLDFDLMVTELAPVDLVLQRSGRLHRHPREDRPRGLREPVMWILGPEERDGLPRFAGGVTYVYDEHVLLRSWLVLRNRTAIAVPEDVSALIEAVYDDDLACPVTEPARLPEQWEETRKQLARKRADHERKAKDVLIFPTDIPEEEFLARSNLQLEEDDPEIHETLQALTRLGEKSVTAICLTPDEMADLQPRADNAGSRAKALLQRSVGLSDRRIVHELATMPAPSSWKRTALLRHCRLVELDASGEAPIGKWRLRIDPELGAMVVGDGEE